MLSVFCFVFAEYQSTVGRLYGQGEQIACVSTVSARVIILQIKFKTQWKDEKKRVNRVFAPSYAQSQLILINCANLHFTSG